MKLLFVTKAPTVGGAELQLFMLAKGLRDRYGVEPLFLFLLKTGEYDLLTMLKAEGINFYHKERPRGRLGLMRAILQTSLIMKRERVAGVISFLDTPSMISAIAHRLSICTRFHIWGIRNTKMAFKKNRWYALAYRLSDIVISNSRAGLDAFTYHMGARGGTQLVISNGVRLPDLSSYPGIKKQHEIIKLCMVASRRPQKRYDLLLDVVKILSADLGRSFQLTIAGRETESLADEVALLNLSEQVSVAGHLDSVDDLLRESDIGILLTNHEGQPNAIIEYMAYGLPVVASDIPEVREVMSPQNVPFLADNDSPYDISEKLKQLIRTREIRESIGGANRRFCESNYSVERMVDAYWEVISSRL